MNRQECRAAAEQSQKVAPQNLEAAKQSLEAAKQGQLLFNLGRYAEALECFNAFDRLNPNIAPLYQTRGLCLQRLGRFEEAQADFERSIALNPGEAETHKNLGTLHSRFGRMEQALASLDRALELRPDFSAALNEKARALRNLQLRDEALVVLHKSLAIDPGNADTIRNLALLLLDLGRHAEALDCFNAAVKLNPNSAALYQMRGVCLQETNRFEEAEADYEKSIALDSGLAETHNNLGSLHSRLGRMEQAFASIERALELRPDFAAALSNKAFLLLNLQLLDEAFATSHRSLAVDPNHAPAAFNLATLQLLTGDFERGWLGREARWRIPSFGLPDRGFPQSLWLGDQPLEGKTILLHADEGLGDAIQFARYVPMVAALGAQLILEVQPPIQRLLAGVPGVATCTVRTSTTSLSFDLHCPLGSLPLAFGTRLDTIPFAQAYLPAPAAARVKAWEDRLEDRIGPRNRLRVGLVWSGNPVHKNDHNRSMALRTLAPLLDCDVQFVSLQKGVRDQDQAFLRERCDIVDLTEHLTDFSETAALVCCLDLVISVDTSVVHLAGALGVPVWTMVPFSPDWRWLLNRDDSPWYRSMRLFRQNAPREWSGVVEQVRTELRKVIAGWSPAKKRTIGAD
ncbi:tetratricopeptide repeat protein [Bradyrhizobium sp. UFLA05-153]